MSTARFIILAGVLVLSGCLSDPPCADMNFDRLDRADKIVLSDNNMRKIGSIDEKARIDEIVAFALAHQDGWKVGAAGTPIPRLRANFYADEKFIGDFGVGGDFLAAQGRECFAFREVSAADRAQLMSLLAASDPYENK